MNCITKYFRVKCEASVQQLKHVPSWVTQQNKAQKEISGICYHGPFKVHMRMCINECLKTSVNNGFFLKVIVEVIAAPQSFL